MRTYIYNGEKVFLAHEDDMPGVKPIQTDGAGVGCYLVDAYNGVDVCLATDEAYCGEIGVDDLEIIDTMCVNPENDQHMLTGWWTKDYAEVDEVERELCIRTGRYHGWTSALTCFLRNMRNSREDQPEIFDEAEWQKEWDAVCDEYTSKVSDDNACDMPDIPTVKDMLEWI